ncbi:MAG: hypothetical protein ACRD3C_06460 [Vicinamibacterales bacterium]
MKRVVIVLGLALMLGIPPEALAQAVPDFSGMWRFNQGKSSRGIAGNTPNIPFPSQLVVKQSPTELYVASTSIRQAPLTATYKLDGSKVTVDAPSGISETGEARFAGATVVITTRRSFSSPAGETVVDFKETWSISGSVLMIEKTRIQDGESTTERAVYDKT